MEEIKGIIESQMVKIIREEITFWEESIRQWKIVIKSSCLFVEKCTETGFDQQLSILKRRISSLETAQENLKDSTKKFYELQVKESSKSEHKDNNFCCHYGD